ncbi:MAG: tetratricopeptide repeat protein [Phycisphaeraceae bacterium]
MSRAVCGVASSLIAVVLFGAAAAAAELPEQVAGYHRVLRQQPEPGYLFDRFYATWFDHGTGEQLETFLTQQVEREGQVGDYLLLVLLHTQQDEPVPAMRLLDRALESWPEDARLWYQKGRLEMQTLDFQSALQALAAANDAQPEPELALEVAKLQGTLYARTGQTEQAQAVWARLLEQQADDEHLYEDLIELQMQEGLFDEALATAKALIERTRDPYDQVVRRMRLGDIHERAGRRDAALTAYAESLEHVGSDSWLERQIAAQIEQLYRREHDLTGLRERYQALLQEHGRRIALRRRYADLLLELGETEAGLAAWQGILELTPGQSDYQKAYMRVLRDAGRHDEASRQLEALIEAQPDDAELLVELAQLQHEADRAAEAAATVQRYIEASDGSLFDHLRAARLLERFGRLDDAEAVYRQAVAAHGDTGDAQRAHAEFLYRADRRDEALRLWRSLAAEADLAGLLNVSRAMGSRGEDEAAYDALHARFDQFADDPGYLGELGRLAVRLERYEPAVPWALRRVEQASSDSELDAALAQAVQIVEEAQQVPPTLAQLEDVSSPSVGVTLLAAMLRERAGESERADALLAEAAEQAPLPALRIKAQIQRGRRDWAAAAATLEQLADEPGGRQPRHLRELVQLYGRLDQTDNALRWTQTWKEVSPQSPAPWLAEAKLLIGTGQVEQGLATMRVAVRRFEGEPDVRAELARLYREQGRFPDAQRHYQRLYEQTEEVTRKLVWVAAMAEVASRHGAERELVERFEQRRDRDRRNIVPLLALAEIHRVTHDYERRRAALMQASRLEPDNGELLLSIARIERQQGDLERAVQTLRRAAEHAPSDRVLTMLARLHLELGEEQRAYNLLYEIAGGRQIDADGVAAVADAILANHDWERAAELLEQHRHRFENDYRLAYLHAVTLEEAMREDEAVERFLDVLRIDQERPSASGASNPLAAYMGDADRLLPPDTIRLTNLQYAAYRAYQYRQVGGVSFGLSRSGVQATVTLPGSLQEAHDQAIVHLANLAATLDEADRGRIGQAMTAAGVPLADVMLDLLTTGAHFGAGLPPTVLERADEEPALAAYWLMHAMQGQRGGHDLELAERAYEMFREDRPQLAMIAALLTADEASAETLEQRVTELIERIEQPTQVFVFALAQATGGHPMMQAQGPALEPELRRRLFEQMLTWADELPRQAVGSGMREYLFAMLASAAIQQEELGAYVRLLEREVEAWADERSPSGTSIFSSMSHSQQLLEPVSFPPPTLPALPPHVLALFGEQGNTFIIQLSPEPEALAEHLDAVEQPLLRVLLAHQAERPEIAEATLAELVEAEAPSLSAHLLAATYAAAEQDDPERAAELLERARHLPMTAQLRQRIDASLVGWALAAGGPETLLEAGRQAALRLRQGQLGPDQHEELALALEHLGLSEQAEELHARRQGQQGQGVLGGFGTTFQGRVSGMRGAPSADQRLIERIEAGEAEEALSAVTRQLRQRAQAALTPSMGQGGLMHEADPLIAAIELHDLADAVLAEARPDDDASPGLWMQYGWISEQLGHVEEAQSVYEQVVERRPNETMLHWRLASLHANEDEPERGAAYLANIPARAWPMIVNDLMQTVLNSHHDALDRRLNYYEMIASWLETREDQQPSVDLRWLPGLVDNLVRRAMQGQESLPGIYEPEQVPGVLEALAERRLAVYERLIALMLVEPLLAEEGFKHKLALARHRDEAMEPFVELAQRVLFESAEAPRQPGMGRMVSYHSSSAQGPRYRTPEGFLVRHAWRSGDRTLIDERILPGLREAGDRPRAERVERFAALYFADEPAFLEAAEAHVAADARATMMMGFDDGVAMTAVVEAWQARQLDVDIVPLAVEQIEAQARNMGWWNAPPYMDALLNAVEQRDGVAGVRRVYEALATALIGPRDQRAELAERHFNPRQGSPSAVGQRIQGFVQSVAGFGYSDEESVARTVAAMEQMAYLQLGETHFGQGLDWAVRRTLRDHGEQQNVEQRLERLGVDPQDAQAGRYVQLLELIDASLLLAEPDTFMTYAQDAQARQNLLGALVEQLADHEAARQALHDWLASRPEPATFGSRLLLALTAEEDRWVETVTHLAEQEQAVAGLAVPDRVALAALIEHASLDLDELEPAVRTAAERMRELRSAERLGAVEALLAARRLEELRVDAYNLGEYVKPIVQPLLTEDPERARQVLNKALDLVHDARQRGVSHVSYGDGGSVGGRLLADVLDDTDDLAGLMLGLELVRDRVDAAVELQGGLVSDIEQAVREATFRVPASGAEAVAESCRRLAEATHAGNVSGLVSALAAMLDEQFRHSAKEMEAALAVAAWSAEEPVEDPAEQALRQEVSMLAVLHLHNHGEHELDPAAMQRAETYYEQVLADTSLSVTYRLYVAGFLVNHSDSAALELAAARVAAEALADADVPVRREQLASIVRDGFRGSDARGSEAWREVAGSLVDAHLRRLTAQQRMGRHFADEPMELTDVVGEAPPMPMAMVMLELALAVDDAGATNRLLRLGSEALAGEAGTWLLLTRHGRAERAATLLRRGLDQSLLRYPQGVHHDEKVAVAVPELLAALGDPGLGYLAEVILASAPDAGPDQSARHARLTALADRVSEVADDTANRRAALLAFGASDVALKRVADALAQEVESWPMRVLLVDEAAMSYRMGNQPALDPRPALMLLHMRAQLLHAEPEPFMQALQTIRSDANQWRHRDLVQALWQTYDQAVLGHLDELTLEQIPGLLPAMRAIMQEQVTWRGHARPGYAFHNVSRTLHVITDQVDAFENWLPEASADVQRAADHRWATTHPSVGGMWEVAASVLTKPQMQPVQRRVDRVQALLRDEHASGYVESSGNPASHSGPVAASRKVGLFTDEELIEHGAALVELAPRAGLSWVELAELVQGAGLDEQARGYWQRAGEAALTDAARERNNHPARVMQIAGAMADAGHLDVVRDMLEGETLSHRSWEGRRQELLARAQAELSVEEEAAEERAMESQP